MLVRYSERYDVVEPYRQENSVLHQVPGLLEATEAIVDSER